MRTNNQIRRRTLSMAGLTERREDRFRGKYYYDGGGIVSYGMVPHTIYTNEPLMEMQALIERTQTWSSQHHASRGTPPRDRLVGSEAVVACLLGVDPENQDTYLSMAQYCYDEELEQLSDHDLWSDIQDICYLYCINEARSGTIDVYGRDSALPSGLGFTSIEQELPTWGYHPVPKLIEDSETVQLPGYTYRRKTKQWTRSPNQRN